MGAILADMSTPASKKRRVSQPSGMIDLPMLIDAMNAVMRPLAEAQALAIVDIKEDINQKHEENKESRHELRNSVETTLAQINLDILQQRERTVGLELKVSQAVGPDGSGGAIEALKAGQAAQMAAITRAEAGVSRVETTLAEYLPTLKALRYQEDARTVIHEKRNQAKDWAELVLKYAAIIGGAVAFYRHFH